MLESGIWKLEARFLILSRKMKSEISNFSRILENSSKKNL